MPRSGKLYDDVEFVTGLVFENEHMRLIVSDVTENTVVLSDGSVDGTRRWGHAEARLKLHSRKFEQVEVACDGGEEEQEQEEDDPDVIRVEEGDEERHTREEFLEQSRRERRDSRRYNRLLDIRDMGIETQTDVRAVEQAAETGVVATVTVPFWMADDEEWQELFGDKRHAVGPVFVEDYSKKAWKITARRVRHNQWTTADFFISAWQDRLTQRTVAKITRGSAFVSL